MELKKKQVTFKWAGLDLAEIRNDNLQEYTECFVLNYKISETGSSINEQMTAFGSQGCSKHFS